MLALYARMEPRRKQSRRSSRRRSFPARSSSRRITTRCVEEFAHVGLPTDCEAILLMETDGHPAAVDDEAHDGRDPRGARRP